MANEEWARLGMHPVSATKEEVARAARKVRDEARVMMGRLGSGSTDPHYNILFGVAQAFDTFARVLESHDDGG